jgi:hypothetical protein
VLERPVSAILVALLPFSLSISPIGDNRQTAMNTKVPILTNSTSSLILFNLKLHNEMPTEQQQTTPANYDQNVQSHNPNHSAQYSKPRNILLLYLLHLKSSKPKQQNEDGEQTRSHATHHQIK